MVRQSTRYRSFTDAPEEELLEKITRLSNKLGLWKDVKKELTSFMADEGDTHNLLEIYLRDKDLASAFKIASQHLNNKYDTERVAKACEKSMPYEGAELYRNMAEESIKQSNRYAYRIAKYYYKAMYRLYTSLNKEKEFRQYIDTIRSANKKEICITRRIISNITLEDQVEDLPIQAPFLISNLSPRAGSEGCESNLTQFYGPVDDSEKKRILS